MLKKLLLLLCALASSMQASTLSDKDLHDYLDSFITHYECNPEGRYTHEYHPFLLRWTSQSFSELEKHLQDNNFSLKGRIVIMGYEENAVPQYYTNFRHAKINDEASRKNNSGWSLRLHNRFGFMSGFLFKGLPALAAQYFPHEETVFQHVDAHMVPIFDSKAAIFQEHAFGEALPLLHARSAQITKHLYKQNARPVLEELRSFWQMLYGHAFTVGNKQIAGTQDVLFSIEYANYLLRSPLPLVKFFIGPDLTYPIEVTSKQNQLATIHAQNFVKIFTKKLKPVDNKNTAYVFCSFVDGVGKSTMLGNIKNWIRFGGDIGKFDHVDNSSSQLAEVFQFDEKVFIADLPAQVSHFTYKPDGFVYVDMRTQYSEEMIAKVEAHVTAQAKLLKEQKAELFLRVKQIIDQEGYESSQLNDTKNPAYAFAKNVFLLKKEHTNRWIPFSYENKDYLFKDGKSTEIRCLIPLAIVKSEGLKNIEAEQMLFFDGIRLPLPYDSFRDDLVKKLKSQGVEHIVFVDFISMYPRSSRENIRINYLLQQMALLDESFNTRLSLYRDFVSGGQLLYLLLHQKNALAINTALQQEAIVRLALFKMLTTRQHGDLTGVALHQITKTLKSECDKLWSQYRPYVAQAVSKKIAKETRGLEKIYGRSKSFVNIQQFSFAKAHAFSNLLRNLFTQSVDAPVINELWTHPGTFVALPRMQTEGERLQGVTVTQEGVNVKGYFVCHAECKNEQVLAPLLRSMRTSWYASILNLLSVVEISDNKLIIDQEFFKAIPLFLQESDGLFYLMQRYYAPAQKTAPSNDKMMYRPFNFVHAKASSFALMDDLYYRTDWESKATNSGLFGFDAEVAHGEDKKDYYDLTAMSSVVYRYQQKFGRTSVIPAIDAWHGLCDDALWQQEQEILKKEARRNGVYQGPLNVKNSKAGYYGMMAAGMNKKVFLGDAFYQYHAQLVVRLLATLEMIIKDPDADIVIRHGSREDFRAAIKLFEHVVLPNYCGLIFTDDLFDDYSAVEPYPSWDYWESVAD